jgi:transcriptional regulator with XRE-family HTH domain
MNVMAEQETRTRLSDLVAERRARLKLSFATLAERCVDPSTGVQEWKIGQLHRLERRQPVQPPTAEKLRALAAGLELPLREVQDAAGEQFLGVITTTLDTSGQVRLLMNRATSMSPEDLERLLAIAETFPIKGGGSPDSSK